MDKSELLAACKRQAQRLLAFRDLSPKNKVALVEYRDWLLFRCADEAQAKAVIDEALLMERRPMLADLNRIWLDLHPPKSPEPEMTPQERDAWAGAQRNYVKDWHAQELEGAAERKRKFLEYRERRIAAHRPLPKISPPEIKPVTMEDIERIQRIMREQREREEREKAAREQAGPDKIDL